MQVGFDGVYADRYDGVAAVLGMGAHTRFGQSMSKFGLSTSITLGVKD